MSLGGLAVEAEPVEQQRCAEALYERLPGMQKA